MIENVEEFGPELCCEAFFEFPSLCHRQIPVVKRQTSEHITTERAIASVRRRNKNGAARSVTTQVRERSNSQWSSGRRSSETIGIARSSEVRNSTVAAVGVVLSVADVLDVAPVARAGSYRHQRSIRWPRIGEPAVCGTGR